MDVTLPEETSSDDWASFHTTEGGIALSGICMFAMPEDCIGSEQRWQPKGFDRFPNELQTTFENQDFEAYNNATFLQGTAEQAGVRTFL